MAEIKLGLSMFRMGYHIAAWRHPDVPADGSMDFHHFLSVTQAAERGKFDLVFMADELAIRGRDNPPGALVRQSNGAELEPITLRGARADDAPHRARLDRLDDL
jgi:N-acetyl-S-(2-succino)cysteine monooxygenase